MLRREVRQIAEPLIVEELPVQPSERVPEPRSSGAPHATQQPAQSHSWRTVLRRFFGTPAPEPPRPAPAPAPTEQIPVLKPTKKKVAPRQSSRLAPGLHLVAEVRNKSRRVRAMSPEEREELFVLFGPHAAAVKGTGLGLHRSRQLARLEEGDILISDGEKDDEIVIALWLRASLPPADGPARSELPSAEEASTDANGLETKETPSHAGGKRTHDGLGAVVLDDNPEHLALAVEDLLESYPTAGFSKPEGCFRAVAAGAAVVILDYDLGDAATALYSDGMAVATVLRRNGFRGLLVLHTNKALPGDIDEKLRGLYMSLIPKGGRGELRAQIAQAHADWIEDPAPPWRAQDFDNLRAAARTQGMSLQPPTPRRLAPLFSEHISDPVLQAQLLEWCRQWDGGAIERAFLQFTTKAVPT